MTHTEKQELDRIKNLIWSEVQTWANTQKWKTPSEKIKAIKQIYLTALIKTMGWK